MTRKQRLFAATLLEVFQSAAVKRDRATTTQLLCTIDVEGAAPSADDMLQGGRWPN
jgi:hypothetical protein